MNEQDVVELFHRIAAEPEPPLRLRAQDGLAYGRRLARRRGMFVTGAAVVTAGVTAVVVVGAAALVRGGPSGALAGSSPTAATGAAAPAEFDPLVALATVRLPAQMTSRYTSLSTTQQSYTAMVPDMTVYGSNGVEVDLYPAAHPPVRIGAGLSPAPAVQGHQAWWWCPDGDQPTGAGISPDPSDSPGPGDTPPASGPRSAPCGTLAWQYAQGGWAVVEPSLRSHLAGDQARRLAQEVAAGIRMERTPVRLGLTIGKVPAGLRITQTDVMRTPQRWMASVALTNPADPGTALDPKYVTVSVFSGADPHNPVTSKAPNRLIDGQPAFVSIEGGSGTVQAYRSGYLVGVEVSELVRLFGTPAAVLALNRSVRVIPAEANWVADPLR